jgi:1,4-dihydroxy-2-naphthoate polyprenyltransferase
MPLTVWLEAARPRTLPAAVAPVLVGTAAAGTFVAWRFVAAFVVGLAVQVGVNFANDYFDGVGGVDTPDRVGPRRAVASGLIAPPAMRRAMVAAFAVAGIAGVALAAAVSWWLLAVGAVCFAAAVGYSGGPRPYASAGLGEVFVFVFFGLVATVGSAFVQDGAIPPAALVAALPMGFLATAILVVNNLRDIPTDERAGKHTLAVRLGDLRTRRLYLGLLFLAFAALGPVAVAAGSALPLLAVAALAPALPPARAVARGAGGTALVPVLAGTGLVQLVYGLLLAAGLALS